MTRKSVKLAIDALPLYASDAELGRAIMGDRAAEWKLIALLFEPRGLPKVDTQLHGRYVPAVLQFFDARHGVGGVDAPYPDANSRLSSHEEAIWNSRQKRRGARQTTSPKDK